MVDPLLYLLMFRVSRLTFICKNQIHKNTSSLPTIDPDYNRSSDNYSLSDAGGTIGSQSMSHFGLQTSQRGTFGSNGAAYEQALYTNSNQYQNYYQQQQQQLPLQQSTETLEIYAPSGKLGVVIDVIAGSPTPIVHAIKDTCPIRDEIRVGDALYYVDDVDVRQMTAVEVSRLISRKSHQEARKLTVGRKMSQGVGMMGDERLLFNLRQFGM